MKFIILFEDNPEADPNIRQTHMAQHLAFLERHADRIEAAGPLSDSEGRGRDGLWIVEVAGLAEAEALVRDDPFWTTGLRRSHAILAWRQVFANGARLIQPG